MFPKSYSNALSSGRRGKLETILGKYRASSSGKKERVVIAFERGTSGQRREDGLFFGRWANVRKTLYIIYEFSSHPRIVSRIDVLRHVDSRSTEWRARNGHRAFHAFRTSATHFLGKSDAISHRYGRYYLPR